MYHQGVFKLVSFKTRMFEATTVATCSYCIYLNMSEMSLMLVYNEFYRRIEFVFEDCTRRADHDLQYF